jgi:Lrp/AsnC family transcriptional regulator
MVKDIFHLDEIDRRIVRAIQKSGDISSADLAERVGASAASCWRRIKALEANGVLGPMVRLVNPEAVGLRLDVLCAIRIKAHDKSARAEFEHFLHQHDEVVACFSISGEWDYQVHIIAADVKAYEAFLMGQLLSHPGVANISSHFALRRIKSTTALPV